MRTCGHAGKVTCAISKQRHTKTTINSHHPTQRHRHPHTNISIQKDGISIPTQSQRKKHRESDRETDSQTNRQTQTKTHSNKQRDTHKTKTENKKTNIHTLKQTQIHSNTHLDKQKNHTQRNSQPKNIPDKPTRALNCLRVKVRIPHFDFL